jgi:radical SAM protein with 4Fe4S-binding SPASM domain
VEILNVIDEVAHETLKAISITGGEPLIRRELVYRILERLQNHPAKTTLNTNGWFLTKNVAKQLAEAGLDIVQISLDSCDEEKHDSFREMKVSYRHAIQAIENSVEAGLETHVRTTITPFNYYEMPSILELALEKGADRFIVKPLILSGRASSHSETLFPEQHQRAITDLLNQIRENPNLTQNQVQFLSPCFPFLIDRTYVQYSEACECGDRLAFIAANGDVQPCGYAHIPLGNILETDLESIWNNSQELSSWRENRLNGKCLVCEFSQICRGGCRAAAYEMHGDFTVPDPACWLEESK